MLPDDELPLEDGSLLLGLEELPEEPEPLTPVLEEPLGLDDEEPLVPAVIAASNSDDEIRPSRSASADVKSRPETPLASL